MHNEINALRDRALDLASVTKISLDYAAGPLLAQFSPAGHLIQQESWQGQRVVGGGGCVSSTQHALFKLADNHLLNESPF